MFSNFLFRDRKYNLSRYFAATNLLYIDVDVSDEGRLKIDYNDEDTWSYNTPSPIRMATVSVFKKTWKACYSVKDQDVGIYSSFYLNKGVSIIDLTKDPAPSRGNGLHFSSRSLWSQDVDTIAAALKEFNGFEFL